MEHLVAMDIDASLKRFCVLFANALTETTVTYEDFDSHADDSSVPPGDLIGVAGVSISISHPFVRVETMIGISTEGDTNLKRLKIYMARLFQKLSPLKTIPVLDYVTGDAKGFMIAQDGTTLLPVGGGESRPIQYVMVRFETTCFADLN